MTEQRSQIEAVLPQTQALAAPPAWKGPTLTQAIVAQLYEVPLDDIRAETRRGAKTALARQIAMYLMHVVYRLPIAEVARQFGRDRSTASHACQVVEDLREDSRFDRKLMEVEAVLRGAAAVGAAQ